MSRRRYTVADARFNSFMLKVMGYSFAGIILLGSYSADIGFGIIATIIIVGIIFLFKIIKKIRAKWLFNRRIEYYQYADIDSQDPIEFENFCAVLLQDNGFKASTTKASYDNGIDIIAYKDGKSYAIQVKHYRKRVGNKAIQEVYSGRAIYNFDYAYVMTNSYYSNHAIQTAQALGVGLWDRSDIYRFMNNVLDKYAKKVIYQRGQFTYEEAEEQNNEQIEIEKPPYPLPVYDKENDCYKEGLFTVGKDIPTGRYILKSEGQGRAEIYKTYEDYENDVSPEIKTFNGEYRIILNDCFLSLENATIKQFKSNTL